MAAGGNGRRSSFLNSGNQAHQASFIETSVNPATDKIITLNVSGRRFQTFESTLARFPESLLGNAERRSHYYRLESDEYFFDRHRPSFESILYFYQSKGIMARPPNIPVHIYINELIFFEVGNDVIRTLQEDNGLKEPETKEQEPNNWLFKVLWQFLENPKSSRSAKYFAFASVFIILISLILFIIETLPEFAPITKVEIVDGVKKTTKMPGKHDKWLFYVNTAVIVWFTVEFVLRFISCPSKLKFFIEVGSIIDFLSILPYYLALAMSSSGGGLAMLRVIRVLRVFKLARHSRGLQILGNTLKASFNELMMLAFFLAVMILIFGSCAYFAEYTDEGTAFKSIPASFWWAIVTMTTVGYGDMAPKTFWGQMVGSMAVVCGVLTIALPVPVVVSNFEYFYTKERNRKKTEEARKDQERKDKEITNPAFEQLSGQLARRFQNLKSKLALLSSRNSPVDTPRRDANKIVHEEEPPDLNIGSPRDILMSDFIPNGAPRTFSFSDSKDGDGSSGGCSGGGAEGYGQELANLKHRLLIPNKFPSSDNVSFVSTV